LLVPGRHALPLDVRLCPAFPTLASTPVAFTQANESTASSMGYGSYMDMNLENLQLGSCSLLLLLLLMPYMMDALYAPF